MKNIIIIFICMFSVVTYAQERRKVVMASTPDTSINKNIVGLFIDELGKGLVESGFYEVVQNRQEYMSILGEEYLFQESGYVDDDQKLEAGNASGAEYACYATIRKIGKNFNITCKFLNLSSGQSVGQPISSYTKNGEDDLIDVAHKMAQELATGSNPSRIVKRKWANAQGCFYDEYNDKYVDCDISIADEASLSFEEACEYCKKKGDGWRLPTKEELLLIFAKRQQIVDNGAVKFLSKDYWSASKRNNYEGFVVNFNTGNVTFYSKNIKNPFRCIRSL